MVRVQPTTSCRVYCHTHTHTRTHWYTATRVFWNLLAKKAITNYKSKWCIICIRDVFCHRLPVPFGAGAIHIARGVEHTTCQIVSRARTLATTARASRMAIASMLGPAKGNRPHHSVRTQRLKGGYSTTNPAACQRNTGQHSFVRRHHGPRSDSIAALLPHCWELILAGKRGMGVRLNG